MANVQQAEIPFSPAELKMIGSFEQAPIIEIPKSQVKVLDHFQMLCDAEIVRGFNDLSNDMEPEAKDRWKKLIEFLQPIVEALFPDAWDFEVEDHSEVTQDENRDEVDVFGARGHLTVYYPHVTILSKKGVDYPITDLYARIYFNEQANITGRLEGARGSLTALEYVSKYAHSHLKSHNGLSHFCQGSTFMRDLLTKLGDEEILDEDNNPRPESAMLFEAFLHQLGAYVSHEAKNGNPYRYISNIGTGDNRGCSTAELETSYAQFKRYCIAFKYTPEFVISAGQVKIKDADPNLEHVLLQITTRKQFKDGDGNFYEDTLKTTNVPATNPSFSAFRFRTQIITQKIIKDGQQEQTASQQQYCHREIKNHIINTLQREISDRITVEGKQRNHERLRTERAERINRIKSAKRDNNGKAHRKSPRFFKSLVVISKDGETGMVGSNVL